MSRPRGERSRLPLLCVTALGIVFGDIGTSPLYALRECFHHSSHMAPTPENVIGILSLIFWTLILVVTVKYTIYVLSADNQGEGGILALMALARSDSQKPMQRRLIVTLGLFGAALLYGDGMITPAISVLSAIEGLEVAAPSLSSVVIPITIVILFGLFVIQRHGTARLGSFFGPIIFLWFVALAALGIGGILREPTVVRAVNPMYGLSFLFENGLRGYLVLGAVFLVTTGAEALYADLGHFGIRPIQIDWFGLSLTALVLNYFGQGALLLADPSAATNPFYLLAPEWARYPLVALAALTTVIASQAVISAVFSLTRQAVQLGFTPRVEIRHTSETEIGQIYVPQANWALMIATITLVIVFGSSSKLAGAYGIAVSSTMVITTLLAYVVSRERWGWSAPLALTVTCGFLIVDLAFFGANFFKIFDGGWLPIAVAGIFFIAFTTWQQGRQALAQWRRAGMVPIERFLQDPGLDQLVHVPGTAVFMTGDPEGTPAAMLHNIKHNKVLHERIAVLTIMTQDVPLVPENERLQVSCLGKGFYRLVARYGFMEHPSVPDLLALARAQGFDSKPLDTTFYLGHETLVSARKPIMARWRAGLFSFMSRNAQRATTFFGLPPNRVVEIGEMIEI